MINFFAIRIMFNLFEQINDKLIIVLFLAHLQIQITSLTETKNECCMISMAAKKEMNRKGIHTHSIGVTFFHIHNESLILFDLKSYYTHSARTMFVTDKLNSCVAVWIENRNNVAITFIYFFLCVQSNFTSINHTPFVSLSFFWYITFSFVLVY